MDDQTDIQTDRTTQELLESGAHERVSINADGSAVVSLHFPLKSGKETLSELTIRRPRAKDLRKMESAKGGAIDKALSMLADLSGRPRSEVDEMDASDVELVTEVMGFLQQPPRRTGAVSSAS